MGNLTQTKYQHSTVQDKKTIEAQTEEFFTYDHTGRLLTVQHQVGNDHKILLAQHEYDELGRLVEKNLHSTNGGNSFLQSVDYHYNVKDWLVRINDLHPVRPVSLDPDDGVTLLENRINALLLEYQEEEEAPSIQVDASTVELANKIVYTAVVEQQATEELEQSLQENLASHGMTNSTVTELLLQNLKEEYEAKWLLLPSQQEDNEDLFEMNLSYDYGGNINHQEWKVASYNYRSIYDYAYDNLDRLTQAEYREYLESSTPVLPLYQNQGAFSVPTIGYDIMGNITELERRGTVAVQGTNLTNGLLDKLTYRYQGNQLQAVQDAGQSSKGFVDGAASNQEYHYDLNGNLIKDDNKQIAIVYNHLNLPKQINFAPNNARIDWLYTATGQKVQKKVTTPNNTTSYKHYIGKVQYLGAELEFIQHQEGRIVRELTGVAANKEPIYAYNYEYCLKDHLGNSRVFFSDLDKDGVVEVTQGGSTNELLQQAHYYPFGMGIEGQWAYVQPQVGGVNQYLYNGKELNEDFGLNWSDYGARWYDASIGRWNGVDPLTEEYSGLSPYNYVANNPLKFVDPDGRVVLPVVPIVIGLVRVGVQAAPKVYRAYQAYTGLVATTKMLSVVEGTNIPIYGTYTMPDVTVTPGGMTGGYSAENPWEGLISTESGDFGEGLGVLAPEAYEGDGSSITGFPAAESATDEAIMQARGDNKLTGDQEAEGDHTTFKRDENGDAYKYETYIYVKDKKKPNGDKIFNPQKRFDGGKPNGEPGAPHINKRTRESIPTPHVQGKKIPGGARRPTSRELPNNNRFNNGQ